MKFIVNGLLSCLFVFAAICGNAQTTKLQVNEVMVNNQTNYTNQYGQRAPWIEIYNNSGASTNMAGCFLSDDPNNLKKYMVTKGDPNTIIGPRKFLVFWADNNDEYGTFHTNFTYEPGKEATIYLSNENGKLVDKLTIPASVTASPDVSYGRLVDGGKDLGKLNPTPKTNNLFTSRDESNRRFKANDPTGFGMSAIAVAVVFSALILLYIFFKYTGKYYINKTLKKAVKLAEEKGEVDKIITAESSEISGEVCAAIAAAIHQMRNDLHDVEDTILTIDKKIVDYSPWSSKIYGLRQAPEIKK